jgi:hypothetical protein
MELQNFSFEQFYDHGDGINATGSAGGALVQLESGNIQLEHSIMLAVESEDITIETDNLSWEDEKRVLAGNETGTVDIQRSDGTLFSGQGFTANVRSRTWIFSGGIEGVFVDTDDDEEEEKEGAEETAVAAEGLEGEPGNQPQPPVKPQAKPPADSPSDLQPQLPAELTKDGINVAEDK